MSLQDKVKQMSQVLESRVRESNGFMTKKGSLLSTKEWHASAIGISWATLSFIMPTPLDAAFVITYLLFIRKVVNGSAFDGTQLGDARSEIAYNMAFYSLTSVIILVFTDYSIESIDVGKALVRVLIGA